MQLRAQNPIATQMSGLVTLEAVSWTWISRPAMLPDCDVKPMSMLLQAGHPTGLSSWPVWHRHVKLLQQVLDAAFSRAAELLTSFRGNSWVGEPAVFARG